MNKYKYKFTNLMVVLLALGMVVALACIGFNSFRFFKMILNGLEPSIYHYLTFIITITLSLLYIIIEVSMLISSYYLIGDKKVLLRFGIIKLSYDLSEFKEIKYYKNQNKVHLIFKDDNLFSINIDIENQEKFIEEITNKDSKIYFIQISDDINKDKA